MKHVRCTVPPSQVLPRARASRRVAFFGHFDSSNLGNESTLQATLFNLRRFWPNAEAICISTGPAAAATTCGVPAIAMERTLLHGWAPRNRLVQIVRRICNGVVSEPYQWVRAALTLRRVDMLVVPGTGLLTDAYGLRNWGPYSLFRWALSAKLCRCKLVIVSVGAGPLSSAAGRFLARRILSLADYRSYRDPSTKQYLMSIGVDVSDDRVCPDLAFSLPEAQMPHPQGSPDRRTVVGLGVMHYMGRYAERNDAIDANYLQSFVQFGVWLIDRGYDVRLLIGDVGDTRTREEFARLLRLSSDASRIIDEPIHSVSDLLSQIAATDLVVATRFHNALLSLAGGKPTLSISFHHKCASLMTAMGMSNYCLDIDALTSEALIDAFSNLQANSAALVPEIRRKAQDFREELDRQYKVIFAET